MDGNWLEGYRKEIWERVEDMDNGISFELNSLSGYARGNTYYAIFRITFESMDRIDYSVAMVHPDVHDAVLILVTRSETINGKTLSPDDLSEDGRIYSEEKFPGIINRIKNNASLLNFKLPPSYWLSLSDQISPRDDGIKRG